MRWAWVAAALIISNLATGYVVKKNSRPKIDPYSDMAHAMSDLSISDGRSVAIIGDSITRRAKFPEQICGLRVVNMGIAGARASAFIQYAEEMRDRALHTKLVVIALGSNDRDHDEFVASMTMMLHRLPQTSLALATTFRKDAEINQTIRALSDRDGATIIDMTGSGIRTDDGKHPSDDEQYRLWTLFMTQEIERILGC